MQSKAMQSKILLKMQSEAKQSIAQQSNAKQFKAMQSTAQAQHKQSKSKAKAMFRELQRASESFRELQRASESSNRRHTKATAKQKQSKSTAHIPFILKHHQLYNLFSKFAHRLNAKQIFQHLKTNFSWKCAPKAFCTAPAQDFVLNLLWQDAA